MVPYTFCLILELNRSWEYFSTWIKGRLRVNRDPYPSWLSTRSSPPKATAMFLLTASPKPTPSRLKLRFYLILVNGVNSYYKLSQAMPTPESSTEMSSMFVKLSISPDTFTNPCQVYLIALESKLMRICLTLLESVCSLMGNERG